jgi:hypothetical protein
VEAAAHRSGSEQANPPYHRAAGVRPLLAAESDHAQHRARTNACSLLASFGSLRKSLYGILDAASVYAALRAPRRSVKVNARVGGQRETGTRHQRNLGFLAPLVLPTDRSWEAHGKH